MKRRQILAAALALPFAACSQRSESAHRVGSVSSTPRVIGAT